MPLPKATKSSTNPWYSCEKCEAILTQKDISLHEGDCPPSSENWNHSYIRNRVLYGIVGVHKTQEPPKNISRREFNHMVFMSQSALQLCKIPIGDPVLVRGATGNSVVKIAWPTNEKTLTSVSLTKHAIDLNKLQGPVRVAKLEAPIYVAAEILIEYIGSHRLPNSCTELDVLVKSYNERRIFTVGNRICVPFYGKNLMYVIRDIKGDTITDDGVDEANVTRNLENKLQDLNISEDDSVKVKFYKAFWETSWVTIKKREAEEQTEVKVDVAVNDIAGYDDLIAEIKDVIDVALGKYKIMKGFDVTKGILLYGGLGVGKSMIAKALAAQSGAYVRTISSSEIYNKYVGEMEEKLRTIFEETKRQAPSIIIMDDIDNFCPKKNVSGTDVEKRVLAMLLTLFNDIQDTNSKILVIATTSKPYILDPSLRRPGRLDKEFEVSIPNPKMRKQILRKFLSKIDNDLGENDVNDISFVTHGFVAADLLSLCSRAAIHAIKQQQKPETFSAEDLHVIVTMDNFNYALTMVAPSAMREVQVEVPNVKWSDIGGQRDLKLKLKQAVEWPLKHPEAFIRLGITPPRGILMFGPPGCSKTMIAKALATESNLNFLNIKGPELFSKWVGESERAVREVFKKARQVAPSIIFIDEIDALGGERASASNSSGGSNVQERVLAQLLTELDGVTALGNVTLVAATNRPDRIDKALLRPGRLDRIVYVKLPDFETRREIFDIKLKKMPVSSEIDINDLVDLTDGYSGAEVQAICHEAAMKALEEDLNATVITKEHFKAALSIVTPRTSPALIKLYEEYYPNSDEAPGIPVLRRHMSKANRMSKA